MGSSRSVRGRDKTSYIGKPEGKRTLGRVGVDRKVIKSLLGPLKPEDRGSTHL